MPQQGPDSIPDEIGGGLVAGRKEKAEHHPGFLGGQLVARVLGLDQPRDQIVAGLAAALPDDGREVCGELPVGTVHLLFLFRGEKRLQSTRQIVGPDLEAVEVALRDPDHPGDHDRGKRHREGLHQIEFPGLADLVEERVRGGADVVLHPGHLAGRECPVHETAQAGVVGRVLREHARREVFPCCQRALRGSHPAEVVAEGPVVPEDAVDVGVAGHHDLVCEDAPVNRIALAQPAVQRIGVRDGVG